MLERKVVYTQEGYIEMYAALKAFIQVMTEVLEDYGQGGEPLSHVGWLARLNNPDRQARQALAKAEGREYAT